MKRNKTVSAADIPLDCYDKGSVIELSASGYSSRVKFDYDQCSDSPWENDDGSGIVSDWTTRSKAPGELLLSEDRGSKRFYDFAGTMVIAKRDGWDAEPYKTGTKGEQAHRAVMANYEFIRQWCNDQWHYYFVTVELMHKGVVVAEQSCGGIESYKDYWREFAADEINGMVDAHKRERADAVRAARKETAEREYWACRDVVTA